MDPSDEILERVLIRSEIEEWVDFIVELNGDRAAFVVLEIILLSLRYQYSDLRDVDNFLMELRSLIRTIRTTMEHNILHNLI